MNVSKALTAAGALTLAISAAPAMAYEAGSWLVRGGVHFIEPQSNSHAIVEVQSAAMASFNVTYMLTPQLGVEVLGSLPFEHDIELADGGANVASVKHLPPTVSVVYHFVQDGPVKPYIGAGINYTLFFDEDTSGALKGADLSVDDSVGLAFVAGVDIPLKNDWFVNADVRYIDIETDGTVKLRDEGNSKLKLNNIQIDPWAFGLTVGKAF